MQLPINPFPYIRAYPHHGFINAILSGPRFVGSQLACVELDRKEEYNWYIKSNNCDLHTEGNKIEMFAERYNTDMYSVLLRKCEEIDELIVKIQYIQAASGDSEISVFLHDCSEVSFEKPVRVELGCNRCDNLIARQEGNQMTQCKLQFDLNQCLYMKAERKYDQVIFYAADTSLEWTKIAEIQMEGLHEKECMIGVRLRFPENQYYNWLFSNYIQLKINFESIAPMDYFTYPDRDWKYYLMNPFLMYMPEPKEMVPAYGLDMWEYIKANIDHYRYIEFMLDEYYLPGRGANRRKNHYQHENLVYGYHQEEKTLDMLGYSEDSYVESITVKYEDFLKAYEAMESIHIFYLITYKPDKKLFPFDLKIVRREIYEYVNGVNTAEEHLNGYIRQTDGVFGMDIYKEILRKEEHFDVFMKDVRISYIMMEHKKCMKDRIQFMIERGYLKGDQAAELVKECEQIYTVGNRLLRIVIKYIFSSKEKLKQSAREYIVKLMNMEKQTYGKLLELMPEE